MTCFKVFSIWFWVLFAFQSLAQNNPTLEIRATHQPLELYSKVVFQVSTPLSKVAENTDLNWQDGQFEVRKIKLSNPKLPNIQAAKLLFLRKGAIAKETALHLDFIDNKWNKSVYVLMPGAVYNGNKFDYRRIAYSPKILDPKDIGPDKPMLVSDIPKLDKGNGPSSIFERSGAMSLPCISWYNPETKMGSFLVTHQGNGLGDFGISIEENRERTSATISLSIPVVRPLYKYRITDNRFPSDDRAPNFKEGDTTSLPYYFYQATCNSIPEFMEQWVKVRAAFYQKDAAKDLLTFSAAFAIQERKFNEQNFVKDFGYYSVGMRENFLQDWQIGWTGGMISTLPLLMAGNDSSQERVWRNFNWLFNGGISPSDYFYDSGEKGVYWYGGDIRKPHTANWHLVRKSGDGLFYILQQFDLFDRAKKPIPQHWLSQTQGVADAFVKTYQKFNQTGNFVDSKTGDVIVGGSTSGAIVPAALVRAYKRFNKDEYLTVAESLAQKYYTEFVEKGYTCGGPGDAMQNPDSESNYSLIESYMALYDETGKPRYLQMAKDAANLFSTWVMAYNYKFPESSLFGKIGIKSQGAVGANTQNKHGAPAICTFSGVGLLKLYRATGNEFYLELLQDITHNMPQYMGHPSKPIPKVKDGWICERVSTTDWLEGIGEITYQSTWVETSLMLTYCEIPSVYFDLANNKAWSMDQVKSELKSLGKSKWLCTIINPTSLPAKVKWVAEIQAEKAKVWKPNYLLDANLVELKPNETKTFVINRK